MTSSMTPERAQECLEAWGDSLGEVTFNDIRSAFRTLAGLSVEEDLYLVNTDTNGGKYEVGKRVRLVGGWVEAPTSGRTKP